MSKSKFLLVALAASIAATSLSAQTAETFGSEGPFPKGPPKADFVPFSTRVGLDLSALPTFALPGVDLTTLQQQDSFAESGDLTPVRIGIVRSSGLSEQDGVWHSIGDGQWLWTANIAAAGALGLRLHFAGLTLPRGAELVAFAPRDPARVDGPIDGNGPFDTGEVWTRTLSGDRARIEYRVTLEDGTAPTLPFALDALVHVYRDPAPPEGGCTIDSSCVSGISTVRNAVGRINYVEGGGNYQCTGQLLQTQAADFTPYFSTANHCIASSAVANTAEIFWRFQSSVCNGTVPDIDTVPTSTYCSFVATQSSSDSTLLLIQGALPSGLSWAGWTAVGQPAGTPGNGIHHPQGTFKKASSGLYNTSPPCSPTDHFGVSWTLGGVDHGSSGSGFFKTSTDQFIGQVHCGTPCASTVSYGRFADFYPVVDTLLAAGSDDSYENNDTCGGLPDLTEGSYGGLVVKGNDDDWYEISVPAGAKLSIDLSFTHAWGDVDTQLWVNCGDTTYTDISAGVSNSEHLEWLNTGGANTVAWRVYLYSDERANYGMTVSLNPENDACSQAIDVVDTTYSGTNVQATNTTSATCGSSATSPDVWYRYVATQTGLLQITTVGSPLDTVLTVYDSCFGTEIACNDDAAAGAPVGRGTLQSYLSVSVADGQDYLVRVAGYNGLTGWFFVKFDTDTGAPFCLGDGISGAACPCSNESTTSLESGCLNSTLQGGRLLASGIADVSADTVTLSGSRMPPNSTCLYFQGSAKQASGNGSAFGDGLRCAAGTVIRLGTKTNSASGTSSYPGSGDLSVSDKGLLGVFGGARYYQVWYRNAVSYCTASTFNVSNGYELYWRP